ncbi:uncharacterized protein METZ01_LOCUS25077 [marine metagenome]|uniref:Uncharacterized protein n=1 Tax=marine metagenome TaxID=408172 RepID=A0A381Q3P7_9ZZZZ
MLSFVIDLKRKKYLAVIDQIIYKEISD